MHGFPPPAPGRGAHCPFVRWTLAVVVLVAGLPRIVDACDPYAHLDWSLPANGGVLPANGAVVLSGFLYPETIEVRVDGVPAAWERVPELEHAGGGVWELNGLVAIRPIRTLPVGALVEVDVGCFSCKDPLGFVVGPPDETDPAPPAVLSFDLHDFPEQFGTGGDCHLPTDMLLWVDVQADENDGAPVLLQIQGGFPGEAPTSHLSWSEPVGSGLLSVPLSAAEWWLEGQEPTDLCLQVFAIDLAGNTAATGLGTCGPCHVSTETALDAGGRFAMVEPTWTDADLFPGGGCEGVTVPAPPKPPPPDPETSGGTWATTSATTGVLPTEGTTGGIGDTGDTEGGTWHGDTTGVSAGTTAGEDPGGATAPEPTPPATGDPATDGATAAADDAELVGRGCACGAGETGAVAGWWWLLLVRRRPHHSHSSPSASGSASNGAARTVASPVHAPVER